MYQKKKKLNFKKAVFPGIMTLLAFISFLYVYWLLTYRSIHPFYLRGLFFALPFILLGVISYLTAQGKIKWIVSTVISLLFSIVFVITSLYGLRILSFEAARIDTSNLENYERVLRLSNESLTEHFPKKIPSDAKNVEMIHRSPFVQAGEKFQLSFQGDAEEIKDYQKTFEKEAIKVGTIKEIEEQMVFDHSAISFNSLVYLFVSEPYEANNWNHGKYSLAAIDEQNHEIIFLMEDW